MKKFLAIVMALSMVFALCAVSASADVADDPKVTLVYAEVNPLEGTTVGEVATTFKSAVEELSGGSITIDIETPHAKDYVVVKVSDTGTGIPEGKAESIFDRFVKLDPYKQGTGLGLSIVQSIVTHFGGNIKVDTDYKKGARFVFTHPYRQ